MRLRVVPIPKDATTQRNPPKNIFADAGRIAQVKLPVNWKAGAAFFHKRRLHNLLCLVVLPAGQRAVDHEKRLTLRLGAIPPMDNCWFTSRKRGSKQRDWSVSRFPPSEALSPFAPFFRLRGLRAETLTSPFLSRCILFLFCRPTRRALVRFSFG